MRLAWAFIELGLVALQIARVLIDQGLVGARIDLREQVASMYGLAFGEVDADDLPLDLGAHDVGVVRNHCAYARKIDRHVVLRDRRGDDRHRRGSGRRSGLFQRVNMREVRQATGCKHGNQRNGRHNNFLIHSRSRSRITNFF